LTSIRLQAESLGDTVPGNALVGRLLEDTSRLEAQVEKTLELARLEGGGASMLQPVPVVAWLERFRGNLHTQDLELAFAPAAADVELLVLADPSALQIIFRDLAENTPRHSHSTPARARITLGAAGPEVR